MLGILYAGWAIISHIGASIRETWINANAQVDKRSNTYMDYHGSLRDCDTNQKRIYIIQDNGEHVLLDTKHKVVRNLTKEEMHAKFRERKFDPKRDCFMETVLKTEEHRTVTVENPITKSLIKLRGTIYKDLDNGNEYFQVEQLIDTKYYDNSDNPNDRYKYFYVDVRDVYSLVRISDYQKEIEMIIKERGKYNWLDNYKDAEAFVRVYNRKPFIQGDSYGFLEGRNAWIHII